MATRRELLIALGAGALAWTGAALGQSKQPILIGWLSMSSRESGRRSLAAFKDGLAALGWKEGINFALEERWAEARTDRLPGLAQALSEKKPAVIVASPSNSVRAAAKAAPNVPIVQANGGDLTVYGLAASLARPGGMITGVTNISVETNAKHLELLIAAAPSLRRVGFLVDSTTRRANPAHLDAVNRACARYSITPRFAEAGRPEEIEPAITRLAKDGAQALIVLTSTWFSVVRNHIVKLALAQRWPVVAGLTEYAEVGALLTYGADRLALYRRAAYYVDRILKGAKPRDLPIEQPTKFELVINLKTAKTLGLTIPQSVLLRADRVIE